MDSPYSDRMNRIDSIMNVGGPHLLEKPKEPIVFGETLLVPHQKVPPLPPLQHQNSVLSSNRRLNTPNFENQQQFKATNEKSESHQHPVRKKSTSKNFDFDFGDETLAVQNLKSEITS